MKKCPEIEDIINLANDPAATDSEIAAHVFTCPACQDILEDAIETADCEYEPTFADLKEGEAAARNLFAPQTDILGDIIKFVTEKLSQKAFLSLISDPLPHLQRRPAAGFAGGAALRSRPAARAMPELLFASCGGCRAWQARMPLPQMLSTSTFLEISIRDEAGAIDAATLDFRGLKLTIDQGKSRLSAADFKNCLTGKSISVIFADGTVSEGDIVFS